MTDFQSVLKNPVLLLVAHWDDEVISAGGAMIRHGKGWDVACATTRWDGRLEAAFNYVCVRCRARPLNLKIPHASVPKPDRDSFTPITGELLLGRLREAGADLARYETVITHHPLGDVGHHPQHVMISAALSQRVARNRLYYFSLEPTSWVVELTEDERAIKGELVVCYRRLCAPSWYPGFNPFRTVEYFLAATEYPCLDQRLGGG